MLIKTWVARYARIPGPPGQAHSRLRASAAADAGGPGSTGGRRRHRQWSTGDSVGCEGTSEEGCLGQLAPCERGQEGKAQGQGLSCLLAPLQSVFQVQQTLLPSGDSSTCHLRLNEVIVKPHPGQE